MFENANDSKQWNQARNSSILSSVFRDLVLIGLPTDHKYKLDIDSLDNLHQFMQGIFKMEGTPVQAGSIAQNWTVPVYFTLLTLHLVRGPRGLDNDTVSALIEGLFDYIALKVVGRVFHVFIQADLFDKFKHAFLAAKQHASNNAQQCISYHNCRSFDDHYYIVFDSVIEVIGKTTRHRLDTDLLSDAMKNKFEMVSIEFLDVNQPHSWPPKTADFMPVTCFEQIQDIHRVEYLCFKIPSTVLDSFGPRTFTPVQDWRTIKVDNELMAFKLMDGTWSGYRGAKTAADLYAYARSVRPGRPQEDDPEPQRRRVEDDSDDDDLRNYFAPATCEISPPVYKGMKLQDGEWDFFSFPALLEYGDPNARELNRGCGVWQNFCPGRCGDILPDHRQACNKHGWCNQNFWMAGIECHSWNDYVDSHDDYWNGEHEAAGLPPIVSSILTFPDMYGQLNFIVTLVIRNNPDLESIKSVLLNYLTAYCEADAWTVGFVTTPWPEIAEPTVYSAPSLYYAFNPSAW